MEAGDPKAVSDLYPGSSSPGMLQLDDWHRYVPTSGSRCTVNKTVFPTEPVEQYILYANEVIIKIGNY